MRLRHVSCRYAEVALPAGPWSLGDPWASARRVALARPEWRPPLDLYETPEAVVARLELAGVREEALSVTLYADALVVEGTRECQTP